ncbi:MAG TPA: hypothetical protein VGM29_19715 [Polyangiaceae bacterium]|jgi:spermidine synthase
MAVNEAVRAPGYTEGRLDAGDTGELAVARFLVLAVSALGLGVDQIALRQVGAYLLPGSSPSESTVHGLVVTSGLLAALVALRRGASFNALTCALTLSSLVLGSSGALWFLAIRRAWLFAVVSYALPVSGALACGVACASLRGAFAKAARGLDVLGYLLRPACALLIVPLLVAYAALASQVGLWRSAAVLGLVQAALAFYVPTLATFLNGRAARPAALRTLSASVFCLALGSYALARHALPSGALGIFPGDVIWRSAESAEYTLVSVQQSLELYSDRELRLTSADATRYAEALVQPACALAPRRERVLLLGLATGLAEQQLLRYPDVSALTSVSSDLSFARLALENRQLRALGSTALRDPKVRLVEAEPSVWLLQASAKFDLIVVDLPDPSGYREGKYYTHYFYQQLREHLTENGVFVTQATSPSSSPDAVASIARTVEGAGFRTKVYAAAVPMLGEWGFVLGACSALEPPALSAPVRAVLDQSSYVNAAELALLLANAPELAQSAPQNTLFRQPVVELLEDERRARGF